MKKHWLLGIGAGLFALGGVALAQVAVPVLLNTTQTDLFQDIPGGAPHQGNQYVTGGQIAGAPAYVNLGTILTTEAFTYGHAVTNAFAHAAGTLAVVTPTTEANPSDGQRECFWLDQTATSLAWTANTGQTINANVIVVGTAKVSNCITYQASTATWYSSN